MMDTIGWQDLKVDVTQHNVTEVRGLLYWSPFAYSRGVIDTPSEWQDLKVDVTQHNVTEVSVLIAHLLLYRLNPILHFSLEPWSRFRSTNTNTDVHTHKAHTHSLFLAHTLTTHTGLLLKRLPLSPPPPTHRHAISTHPVLHTLASTHSGISCHQQSHNREGLQACVLCF